MNLGKKTMPRTLFVGQLIAMLSIIPLMVLGSLTEWIITVMMYLGIVTLGISLGYHRYLSHRMFECNVVWQVVMMFFAHIMMVGSAILWVANHREHHRYTDTRLDPHSPHHKGWFYAHFLQVFTEPNIRYMTDLLRKPAYKFQHTYYWELLALWAVILYVLDPFAIVYAWLAPAGFAKIIGSLVFSYSHRRSEPHNDAWLGYLTGGEGWHERHHTNPNSYRWHPHDLGANIIDIIATNVKSKPYKIV